MFDFRRIFTSPMISEGEKVHESIFRVWELNRALKELIHAGVEGRTAVAIVRALEIAASEQDESMRLADLSDHFDKCHAENCATCKELSGE
jgi:hypothetical protein